MFIIIRIPIHTTKNSIFQLNLQLLLIWTKRDWNKAISLPLSSCFSKLTSQDITFLLLQIQFYFFVVVIEPSWRLKLALKPYVQSAAEYSECVCGSGAECCVCLPMASNISDLAACTSRSTFSTSWVVCLLTFKIARSFIAARSSSRRCSRRAISSSVSILGFTPRVWPDFSCRHAL